MGSKSTAEETYKRRTSPVSVDDLTVVDTAPRDTSIAITEREKRSYLASVVACGNAVGRERNEARLKKDIALFGSAYTTECKLCDAKARELPGQPTEEGYQYWEVNTYSIKE